MSAYYPFLAALVALLIGLTVGKAWERYKLRSGRLIDRRRVPESLHYIVGLNFLVTHQVDLAIAELTKAAENLGDALEIHLLLGSLYREKGQVSRAINIHQGLLQRPRLTRLEQAHILLCLGLDFKRGGFVDRALEAFNEVRRLDPGNQYALLYLQKLHEEQHQWDDAYRIRQQLVELTGPDTKARSQSILAFLDNERGVDALKAGQVEEAVRRFHSAIDLDSATTPAYLNLGDATFKQGDTAGAVAIWERLLTASPDRGYLVFDRLAAAHAAAGAPHKFEDRCREIIAANPNDWRARVALGAHMAARGDQAAAFEVLLQALSHNPHGLAVHQAIWNGMLELGLSREHVQRYIDAARDAVFFLDPHVCVKCHYRSTELLWQCPHCHEWNTFVEERIAPAKDTD